MNHMEENWLFKKHQHGFRKGQSCITQLIDVCENWTEELDNRNNVDNIYLDFQKAFDTVPHQRLITKLKCYGIQGDIIRWIGDFLKSSDKRNIIRMARGIKWDTAGQRFGPKFIFRLYKRSS